MKKCAFKHLVVLAFAVLILINPFAASALQVAPGASFSVPLSFNTDGVPITSLRVVFYWTEGLTFNGGSSSMGSMSTQDMGGVTVGTFGTSTPVDKGTIYLRFTAGIGVAADQAVMLEGSVIGTDANDNSVPAGSGGRTPVLVSLDGEIWPDEWTVETPATYESEGLEYRVSSLDRGKNAPFQCWCPSGASG